MNEIHIDTLGQLRYPEHPYDRIVKLIRKVQADTSKHCSFDTGVFGYRQNVVYKLYLEDGWIGEIFAHKEVDTLGEAVEFLEAFLRKRADRGVLFKRF